MNGDKPTFEERMQAIAETLDLVAHMQLKTEKELGALTRSVRSLVRTGQMIIAGHELRLRDLENHNGGEQDKED